MPKKQSGYQFVCIKFSPEAEKKFTSELYRGEQHTVLWRTEAAMLEIFKRYGKKSESRKGESGALLYPTLNKAVELHYRFEGVEEGRPVFFVGDVTWRSKPCKYPSKDQIDKEKKRFVAAVTIAFITITALLLEEFGILSDSFRPMLEVVAALSGVMSYIFSG